MSRFRFHLRSLLVFVALASVVAWCVSRYFQPDPVREIVSRKEWNAATRRGRVVLFVDGHWNQDMVQFNRKYAEFAQGHRSHSRLRTLRMTIDSNAKNEVWTICQELWRVNSISQGGLKNYGGAGRVVWLDNGRVVDHAWCNELFARDALNERTRRAFHWSVVNGQ
jgi:hypothetical protein